METLEKICKSPLWELIRVDDREWDRNILQQGRQLVTTLGAHIQDNFLGIRKVINPTESNWFISAVSQPELDYIISTHNLTGLHCALEIGLRTAGTHTLFRHLSQIVISVENDWESVMCSAGLMQYFDIAENSVFIWGDSQDKQTVQMVENELLNQDIHKIDLLFIDGNHSYDVAYSDLKMYYPLVKKGGWILLDDLFTCEGIFRATDKFAKEYDIPNVHASYSEKQTQGIAYFQSV